MPYLEISFPDSERERQDLTKQAAVTIGRHSSNDIPIDDPEVGAMHCRVSWTGNGFEAVAAGAAPLEVNGIAMRHAHLKVGDLLRFGVCDIRYRDNEDDGVGAIRPGAVADSSRLKPVTEELPAHRPTGFRPAPPPAPQVQPATPAGASRPNAAAGSPAVKPIVVPDSPPTPIPQSIQVPAPPGAGRGSNFSPRVREALRTKGTRPGEEDILRSPLVVGLSGFAVVLLLASVIFYFISVRQTAQQAFDAANDLYNSGDFHGSIVAFDKFLEQHPTGQLSDAARRRLQESQVRQYIDGTGTQFELGLEALRALIADQRERDGFETLHASIFQYARTIALGAATLAARQMSEPTLEISRQARMLVTSFAPKDVPPTETLQQIDQATREAEKEILKDEVYRESMSAIDLALEEKQAIKALSLRRDLLVRYSKFENDKRLAAKTQIMLQVEQQHVKLIAAKETALKIDHVWPTSALTLAFQSRTNPDEVAVGAAVLLLAQDCCYGIEMVTGQPLWRRVVGFDLPFFPIVAPAGGEVVFYDTSFREMVCLQLNSGKFLWRLPLEAGISGIPLLSHGTLYTATRDKRLLSIQIANGEISECLQFSQPVSGPVELENQQELVVAGNEETIYLLGRHPLSCISVMDLGQKPGAVQAPLLSVANYVLLAENGASRATLHLLLQNAADHSLKAIASKSLVGRVTDSMVLRGRDLFVPSTGERVSAFIVSDDAGQPPLTAGAVYAGEGRQLGPTFLLPGPDRQLWMATGALQRLRLATDNLQADSKAVSPGIATQPLVFQNGQLYHARRRPPAATVILSRTDREELSSDWQLNIGGRLLATSTGSSTMPGIITATDAGLIYRVPLKPLEDGGFFLSVATRLPLPANQQGALYAGRLSNSRLAVVCGDPEPRLWTLNVSGQIESTSSLPSVPEAPPLGLENDVIVPLAGRIIAVRGPGRPPVQEFALPTDVKSRWVNVVATSKTQLAAASHDGVLRWLKAEETPKPFLAEVAQVKLGDSVTYPVTIEAGMLAAIADGRTLHLFDASQFQSVGKRQFAHALSGPARVLEGLILVESEQHELHAVVPDAELQSKWIIPLAKTSIAGAIRQQDQLVVALQNGAILKLNAETGEILHQTKTGNALASMIDFNGRPIVVTTDGSLISIETK